MLISIIITLIILYLTLWIIDQTPIDGTVKIIIYAVVIAIVILYLLQNLGFIVNYHLVFPHS